MTRAIQIDVFTFFYLFIERIDRLLSYRKLIITVILIQFSVVFLHFSFSASNNLTFTVHK